MSLPADAQALVSTFNAVPRNRDAPSGRVPNHFHFSIRHIPLTPPGYVVFIIQPASRYVHVEGPLPANFASETLPVKATAISILLLKSFNKGLGGLGQGAVSQIGRPWSWVCSDAETAGAVGEALRGMGVTAPEGLGVAQDEENTIADQQWEQFFGQLQGRVAGRG